MVCVLSACVSMFYGFTFTALFLCVRLQFLIVALSGDLSVVFFRMFMCFFLKTLNYQGLRNIYLSHRSYLIGSSLYSEGPSVYY